MVVNSTMGKFRLSITIRSDKTVNLFERDPFLSDNQIFRMKQMNKSIFSIEISSQGTRKEIFLGKYFSN
jgi:hypothetical protein